MIDQCLVASDLLTIWKSTRSLMIPYLKTQKYLHSIGLHLERHSTHDERLNTIIELGNSQFSLPPNLGKRNYTQRLDMDLWTQEMVPFIQCWKVVSRSIYCSGFFDVPIKTTDYSLGVPAAADCDQKVLTITLCMEMYKDCSSITTGQLSSGSRAHRA